MSNLAVRAALETALAAITPALPTAWENKNFVPPAADQPYQAAFIMFTEPDNPEMGAGYQERGFMQVNLVYPENTSSGAIGARAKLIRDTFYRGLSLTQNGVTVMVNRTPAIGNGSGADGRFNLPVKIPFEAQVFT